MKDKTLLTGRLFLTMICIILNIIYCTSIDAHSYVTKKKNLKEVNIVDKNLIREIRKVIYSDSIKAEIKKHIFPYANFNSKYINIYLTEYPYPGYPSKDKNREIVESLVPRNVCIDSCKLLVTMIYHSGICTNQYTVYRGDTLYITDFEINKVMNTQLIKPNGKTTSIIYSFDFRNLTDYLITQFLYINGKLYLNPNKTEWYDAYQ